MTHYNEAGPIYGEEPLNIKSEEIWQSYKRDCAIKSQQIGLDKFGIHISEDQLVDEAIQNGWYDPNNGTYLENVGNLMELHGVPVNRYENGNIFNVIDEMSKGHFIIMGVDSGELWHPGFWEQFEDKMPLIGGPDHALIVSGVNLSNQTVVLTDPGTGDLLKEYPLEQFIDAAKDSHFFMVTTQQPIPHFFDDFPQGTTHLPKVGDMTYEFFHDHYASLNGIAGYPVFEEFKRNFWFSSEKFGDNPADGNNQTNSYDSTSHGDSFERNNSYSDDYHDDGGDMDDFTNDDDDITDY